MTTIPALTVRQPWADALIFGSKDVENRSRYFSLRGPLLIHAATKIDELAMNDRRILDLPPRENKFVLGHLIGVVTLVDCVRHHGSQWAEVDSPWKLIVENPRALSMPVPYRGQLSLFKVDTRLVFNLLPAGSLEFALR